MGAKVNLRLAETAAGTPPSRGPQSVGIVLTNACNLRCLTCWSYSPLRQELPQVAWQRQRLDHAQLTPLFAELAALGTERVIFTGGGDPLAHPAFYEIAADAKNAGLKVTLISNLTLVRERERFLSLHLDTVLANFSCGDAATYTAFHPGRTEADFARLLDLLGAVSAAGTQLKLVFVVCAINYHAISSAITLAARLCASLQLKLMSASDDTRALVLTEAQRTTLLAQRDALTAQAQEARVAANLDVFYTELSGESPERFPIEQVGCYAGHYYSRITATGAVFFCCNQHPTLAIGSLTTDSFTSLWHSARYQAVRQQLRDGGFVPGCERCGKFDLNDKVHRQLAVAGTMER